jgi:outer membrane usher protein
MGAAAATPLRVSVVPQEGAAVRIRIDVPAGSEPVLAWAGLRGPGPYPLALIWSDAALELAAPLPAMPHAPTGPLQSIALRTVGSTDRLEVLLRQPVYPRLRRIGSTWFLDLLPETRQSIAVSPPPAPGGVAPAAPSRVVAPEPLLVDLTVNGLRQADIARAELLPDGKLLIASENWEAARLAPVGAQLEMSDGTPAFAVDQVPGARFSVDRQLQRIDIEVPPAAFIAESMAVASRAQAAPGRSSSGALLNYDVTVTRPGNGTPSTSGATVEAIGFGRFGTAVTSAVLSDDGTGRKGARLDSYWRYDMPDSMQSVVVGDTIGVGGGWSRPVRYGGLRWGRDFGLRPGFVQMPLATVTGEAALPSTVDLLINDSRRFSQSVRPGPFDLTGVPVITGAGELSMVVRDLLGRQTVIRQSYYASPRLLAPGLTDFSMEAGWLRTGFGRDSDYGESFAAATVRRGMTPRVTAEGRIEVQRDRQATGLEVTGLLGTWGVGRVAGAVSRDQLGGAPGQGALMQLGIERRTPLGGGAVQYEYATRDFSPFGESRLPGAADLRSREQVLGSIGGRLWGTVNGGVNYVRRVRWNGDRASSLGLSLSFPIAQASLTVSAARRLDDGREWSGSINLNVPLGGDFYTAARAERQEDGSTAASVLAVRTPPAGPGTGWRVESSTDASQRARVGVQQNTNRGDLTAEVVADADARVSSRAGLRGTLGMMSGLPFASRPIGHGSFAVVQVEGMSGVPIKRSNQVVAETDERGLAFVPGLVPWHRNVIEIDVADLPLDVEVSGVTQEVVPYARSGSLVSFDVRRARQALLVLRQADGQPVPVGTRVQVLDGGEFRAGRRGEVWLTDLTADRQRVRVSWKGHGCELDLRIPPSEDGAASTVGPIVCKQGSP